MSAISRTVAAALIDFLWQGTLVGLLLWCALRILRSHTASLRYAVCCAAFAIQLALPVATALSIAAATGGSTADVPTATTPAAAPSTPEAVRVETGEWTGLPQTLLQIWFVPGSPRLAWLDALQAWMLPVWITGVFLLSARLGAAWLYARTLRRGAADAEPSLVAATARLAERMGVNVPVRVLQSQGADGPLVTGWLRPVLLCPPAAFAGMPVSQVEAILAHELAHIRRRDYLVNMVQMVGETLLFFHPAVWWVSARIRAERELCCDDVAVRTCGDARGYARALAALARRRVSGDLALAASGGDLVHRVRRLVEAPRDLAPPAASGAITALAAVAMLVPALIDLGAQSPSEPQLRFDVASIKRNVSNDRNVSSSAPPGRYRASGLTLQALIRAAYGVQEFQIVGAPDWATRDRFDVDATYDPQAAVPAKEKGRRTQDLMLRTLLEERFTLRVHKETMERPVFALVLSRPDRRPGPQLRPPPEDCAARQGRESCGTSVGPGIVSGRGITMAEFADALSRLSNTGSSLHRLVIDRTGLPGKYDVTLTFTPENVPPEAVAPGGWWPALDPNGPSIFTAVQEQLGLKLDVQKGPVEMLVVDGVEPPTEN